MGGKTKENRCGGSSIFVINNYEKKQSSLPLIVITFTVNDQRDVIGARIYFKRTKQLTERHECNSK